MNREETKLLLVAIATTYPNFKVPDRTIACDIWTDVLQEYSYEAVMAALKVYIKSNTSGFAPAPGQLIEIMHSSVRTETNEAVAWMMVRKAIGRGNYYAKEDFEHFPESVQQAVGSWEQLKIWASDTEYNEGVISSNFKRNYRTVLERKREEAKIPLAIRQQLTNLVEGVSNGNRLQECRSEVSVLPVNE